MSTGQAVTEHPVFKEVFTILQPFSVHPNPETWLFDSCPALAKSTEAQCRNAPKIQQRVRARELFAQIKLMKECPDTDMFFDQLKEFLFASYCWSHQRKALGSLEEWKKARLLAKASPSADRIQTTTDDGDDGGDDSSTISDLTRGDSLTRSDDGQSDILTPPSTAPATQIEDPLLDSTRQPEISSETVSDASVQVATVTDSVSAMTINDDDESNIINNEASSATGNTEQIIGLGLVKLERKGSVRNPAPVFAEIYKPLTKMQQQSGIVYVLESQAKEGLFKIGWTARTVEQRLSQPGNCDATNSEILYQSRDGPFFAAPKAEKLAQTVLRHHSLTVVECSQCGGGHINWFKAPREMVLETVAIMENFVQLPAYESPDGGQTWKVSDVAHKRMQTMWEFSPRRLRSAMAPVKEHSADETLRAEQEAAAGGPETPVLASSQASNESLGAQSQSTMVEDDGSGKLAKGSKKSAGASVAKGVRKVGKTVRRVSEEWGRIWKSPRESTADGDGKDRAGNSETGDVYAKDAVMGVFVSLFPAEARTWAGDVNGKEPRQGNSWFKAVKTYSKTFLADFEEEWKREEREEAKAG